jgi:hypothetical protein
VNSFPDKEFLASFATREDKYCIYLLQLVSLLRSGSTFKQKHPAFHPTLLPPSTTFLL